jgi:hypothetical protein
VEPLREIEALVAFEGRAAGTDSERRAAEHLAERLRALGREAEVEPISVWPNWALTHLLHALIAIVGSVVAVGSPPIGLALVALAAVSTLADITGTFYLVRRLTGRRASQNVTSPEEAEGGAGVLVLVAHYDAAHGGSVFGPRAAERGAALSKRLRLPIGLAGAFMLAIVVVLLCAALRLVGLDSTFVSVVQFLPTVALILSVPLLADIQLTPAVPGAADNASGVAAVLELAERHGDDMDDLSLWVVFTGAQESLALGMREWLKAHRRDLPKGATLVVNLDGAGAGTVRYAAREGPIVAVRQDRELVNLCEEIASEDAEAEEPRFRARAFTSRSPSDALVARARGHRAVTISSRGALDQLPNHHRAEDTTDRIDAEALGRTIEFSSRLVELIDARLGASLR